MRLTVPPSIRAVFVELSICFALGFLPLGLIGYIACAGLMLFFGCAEAEVIAVAKEGYCWDGILGGCAGMLIGAAGLRLGTGNRFRAPIRAFLVPILTVVCAMLSLSVYERVSFDLDWLMAAIVYGAVFGCASALVCVLTNAVKRIHGNVAAE